MIEAILPFEDFCAENYAKSNLTLQELQQNMESSHILKGHGINEFMRGKMVDWMI